MAAGRSERLFVRSWPCPGRSGPGPARAPRARRRPRGVPRRAPRPRWRPRARPPRRGPRASDVRRPRGSRQDRRRARRGGGSGRGAAGRRSTAAPISSCRKPTAPSRSTRKPCSMPSASPAVRSASRIAVAAPRGADRARGRARSVSTSKSAATAASCAGSSGRPGRGEEAQDPAALERADAEAADDQLVERAGQRRGRQLAAGGQQLLGHERAAAGSLGDEQQQAGRGALALDALDERGQLVAVEERQRRAAPAAEARRRSTRPARDPRVVAGDDVRLVRDDERQPLVGRRSGRGRSPAHASRHPRDAGPRGRARRAAARQAGRACRGRPRASAPGGARARPSCRVDGSRPPAVEPRRELGRMRTTSAAAGPRTASSSSSERASSAGPTARTTGPYGSSVPAGIAPPRRTRIGSVKPADAPDRLVEEPADPDAGRAADEHRPRPSAGRIVEDGGEPREGALAPHVPRARVPAGHGRILGRRHAACSSGTGRHARGRRLRLGWVDDDRRPPRPAPRQHAQRADRGGVALLHEVRPDHGLPLGARARGPQGARRQQAAAPHGPPHRVLHEDRRARPRPVRRRRRDAARRGDRARATPGARHRARAALGGGLRAGRARPRRRARRRRAGHRRSRPVRPGRPARLRPVRARAPAGRRAGASCRPSPDGRSTSSPPTRRTTSSCR